MPSFDTSGNATRVPFGKNVYLRSTRAVKTESYTCAASTVTAETIDGVTDQKVLQSGEVMAKITSGADAGKIGPFQRGSGAAGAAAVNEVQQFDLGAASAGTITITFSGQTTAAIARNATAATVQAALETLSNVNPGDIVVTGGPLPGAVTLTFGGQYAGVNVPEITITPTGLTGGTVTISTVTPGSAAGVWAGAASDGRGDPANIVGINDTFLPWQLMHRDVEVAATYDAAVVQGWCFERDAAGARIPLTNATRDAMLALKTLQLRFS
jgi:hypothetical protein